MILMATRQTPTITKSTTTASAGVKKVTVKATDTKPVLAKPADTKSTKATAKKLAKVAKVIKAAKPVKAPQKDKAVPLSTTAGKTKTAMQKPKQPKLVRDSFTMPQADHALIKLAKKAAVAAGRETKKSEVIRAAIQVFSALALSEQISAYGKLATIAVGRPKAK
jgi:hypothetical protein